MQLTISLYGVLPADRYDLAPVVVQHRRFLCFRFNPQDEYNLAEIFFFLV